MTIEREMNEIGIWVKSLTTSSIRIIICKNRSNMQSQPLTDNGNKQCELYFIVSN